LWELLMVNFLFYVIMLCHEHKSNHKHSTEYTMKCHNGCEKQISDIYERKKNPINEDAENFSFFGVIYRNSPKSN
jgi:hypothetical protein